jgi:tetratricopeptide (TPR) repeat protein
MHARITAALVLVGLLAVSCRPGEAGDQPEHRHMVYALGVAAGFTPAEAKVVADGSWSIDNNDATLALKGGLRATEDVSDYVRFRANVTTDNAYAARLLGDNAALDHEIFSPRGGLARIGPAALMHSLMRDPRGHAGDPNTPGLDAAYRDYIREQARELRATGHAPADVKTTQLLLVGQHMHQLVDSFVHPQDPILGHVVERHGPDYAVNNPDAYARAGFKALTAMRVVLPEIRPPDAQRDRALRFDTPEKQLQFTRGLVDAVARGYNPTYLPSHPELSQSPVRNTFEVSPDVLTRVTANVERYMGGVLAARGSTERFAVPPFQNATYTAGGDRFEIRYPGLSGGKVNVDNVVRWVLEHPDKYRDLAQSVRESMRGAIRDWNRQGLSYVEVARDQVGGVLIRFAPGTWEGSASEEEARQLVEQLHRFLETTGKGGLILRRQEPRHDFHVVSLRWVLASGTPTLGRLTRVLGYVLDPAGDPYVVGLAEPEQERIPVDVLTVALRAIWKQGQWPFVSLDPTDPDDLTAAHAARIGGVPADLEDTEFVRTMLEADYTMKRIDVGKERPEIEGFKSFVDLMSDEAPADPVYRRAWLAPVVSPVGDLFETRRGPAAALVFDSQVQVLTETMKRVGSYLTGTGRADPIAEEAARLMTVNYAGLEAHDPVFRRLHVLFDVAKLCAVWRARGVASPVLEALAGRMPARTEITRRYDGLVADTDSPALAISGGATTRGRVSARTVVVTDRLTALLDAVAGLGERGEASAGEIVLPATVQLDPSQLGSVSAEMLVNGAVEDFAAARHDAALARLDLALELDPDLVPAQAYRALARLSAGQVAAAMADIDRAVAAEPALTALRGLVRAYVGDAAGALRDAETAERGAGADEAGLLWAATARLLAFDLPGAERTAARLIEITPMDPVAYDLLTQLDVLHGMGRARARQRVAELRQIPIPIADAYASGWLHHRRFESAEAVDDLRRCRALTIDATADTARAFPMRERCGLALALALITRARLFEKLDPETARQLVAEAVGEADAIVAAHPAWASATLLKGLVGLAGEMSGPEAVALFQRALSLRGAPDPLMEDLGVLLGSDRAFAQFGVLLFYQLGQRKKLTDREAFPLLDALAGLLGDRVEGRLVRAIRRAGGEPNQADALAILRGVEPTIPDRLPADSVTMLCTGLFYSGLLSLEEQLGDPVHAQQAALRLLRLTNVEFRSWDVLTITALFRFAALTVLGQIYERRVDDGEPAPDVIAAARADAGPFAAAFVELATRKGGETGPARWGLLIDNAQTAVELRGVLFFLDMFSVVRALDSDTAGADARTVAALNARLKAKLKPRVPVAHAWASWR